ncbi:MAG: sulfatase, partial [Actinoplanes sp.]
LASDTSAALAKTTARQIPAALRDQRQFLEAARNDPFRGTPPADLVAGLAGKDVIFGVVESYGRSVLEDPAMAAVLDPVLRAGEQKLAGAGYRAKSGMLTSSTFGGGSWLAHGTFQSGLWINSQQRYRQLTAGDRLTLTGAFQQAGWRTVGVEPGNTVHWPEAAFYGYDTVYDSRNMGYRGPRFGWSRMPDQYTLAAFQRDEYAKKRGPLMAELTLTSSHEPWTPVPSMIDWDAVGDGSVFASMAKGSEPRKRLWKDQAKTQLEYARSVAYSVDSLVSWAEKYGDENLVLIIFGDHQPIPLASGNGASHDVPITVVAQDPAVLDRIAGWGWQDGLKPGPEAPLWRMDEFRDRFFTAFGRQEGVALARRH